MQRNNPHRCEAWRGLASTTLANIGGPQVKTAVKVLLEKDIDDDAREAADKILSLLDDPNA